MISTYKSAFEDRVEFRIPSNHALTQWIVDHAASVYNRHVCNADRVTPYEAIHGQHHMNYKAGTLKENYERRNVVS